MPQKPDDPRFCPVCGERGRRRYYTKRRDAVGLRYAYKCPACGHAWDVRLQRVGTAKNPFGTKLDALC